MQNVTISFQESTMVDFTFNPNGAAVTAVTVVNKNSGETITIYETATVNTENAASSIQALENM